MRGEVRLGVVGYGVGGRLFHTPFVEAASGITLAGVVTRSPERRAELVEDWPGVEAYDSLRTLLESGVEAVTITTPPHTHHDLALEAIAAGVHVLVDKPFATTATEAREMVKAADAAGVLLSVYQNRRWDADIRTLERVLSDGAIGDVWRVHARMDQNAPNDVTVGHGRGLLLDLGSHLVDQMLWLFGPATRVNAHLDWVDLPEGRTDGGLTIELLHAFGGVTSYIESSKLGHVTARELRVYGSSGSYTALSTDVQEQAILGGKRPAQDPEGWGWEDRSRWGVLATSAGEERIPSAQGRWHDLYTQFAAAIRGMGGQPVPASQGLHTMQVLDAARQSAMHRACINVV